MGTRAASVGGASLALTDLLENAGDAILLIDPQDVLWFWNLGAERMFGHRRDEVLGRKIDFLVPPDRIEGGELETIRRRLDVEGVLRNHLTRRLAKDGTELPVSLTRSVLLDGQGHVLGSLAILRDISEQLRSEGERVHARQVALVGEMAATLAHQVKNPLAAIQTAIRVLARDLPAEDERRAVFESIGAEIRRLDDSVVDLLRFSRPVPPHPLPTDLRRLFEGLCEDLRDDPVVAVHELQLELPPDLVLELDEAMAGQAFRNLIQNAAQAMSAPGRISISALPAGDHLVLLFRDEGPGIPDERLDSVFDPFITTKTRGTGLGLSIARKHVEAHGGTLVADPGVEAGACFRVSLPRRAVRPRAGPESP